MTSLVEFFKMVSLFNDSMRMHDAFNQKSLQFCFTKKCFLTFFFYLKKQLQMFVETTKRFFAWKKNKKIKKLIFFLFLGKTSIDICSLAEPNQRINFYHIFFCLGYKMVYTLLIITARKNQPFSCRFTQANQRNT